MNSTSPLCVPTAYGLALAAVGGKLQKTSGRVPRLPSECALCSLAAGWACIWLKATNKSGAWRKLCDTTGLLRQPAEDISTFGLRGFLVVTWGRRQGRHVPRKPIALERMRRHQSDRVLHIHRSEQEVIDLGRNHDRGAHSQADGGTSRDREGLVVDATTGG